MNLTKEQGNKVVIGLVNDPTITDDYWEEKVQHIRDDLCFHIRKYDCVKIDKLVDFHGDCIYEIIKKYLGDD